MFHYLKTTYIICIFFAKFIYNEYSRPYFLMHVVSTVFTSDLPKVLASSFASILTFLFLFAILSFTPIEKHQNCCYKVCLYSGVTPGPGECT
jgi:hypothetical protein